VSTPTNTATATAFPTLAPLSLPTIPPGGEALTFFVDTNHTGWLMNKDNQPHWRDRSLLSGKLNDQTFISVMQFDLQSLAPNSKILFAALEVTGRDASNLGPNGKWSFELVDSGSMSDDITFDAIAKLPALATIGSFESQSIAVGVTNRLVFESSHLALLEKQLENGKITVRLRGPSNGDNNLFAWDAGPGRAEPRFFLVAIPAPFVVITTTPTPPNVFAAATRVAEQTAQARTIGTPTPLPRSYVTATRGPDYVVITDVPTPVSMAARTSTAVYATAVAATTGTFTPMPFNWVTATPGATPTPGQLLIPRELLTPVPSPTPTTAPIHPLDWAKRPLPSVFYNKIIFLEGSRSSPNVWLMDPDGKNLQLVTDRQYHYIAKARDAISPDGRYFIYNDPDDHQRMQIWRQDVANPTFPPQQLTFFSRPSVVTFGPSWSPDGTKIAFTSNDPGRQEIFIYDVALRSYRQITFSSGLWWWNQFPSWSPDGKKIVYSSDRGHDATFSEIWVMDADGGNARNLGDGIMDAYDPVWVKWRQ